MNELFGIPMNSIMVVLLVLLGICLLSVAFIAWRRPVIFKLGVRNIPRRKAQTSLIVVGLMLATLIISAALGTGDTLDRSINRAALDTLGPVDELIVYSNTDDGEGNVAAVFSQTMPESNVEQVADLAAGNEDIAAVGGLLYTTAPALNIADNTGEGLTSVDDVLDVAVGSEPSVSVAGLRQQTLDDLGGLSDVDGNAVDLSLLGDESVYLGEAAAESMEVEVGDQIVAAFGQQPVLVAVQAIVPDSTLTGALEPNAATMLFELGRLQELTGNDGEITAIGVSNVGSIDTSVERTDAVVDALQPELAGTEMGIVPIKQMNLDDAQLVANLFVTMFVVFGLFSIGVGILLIVLIFTMLAAERRSEMGMARAVGAQRRMLIQQFISEGAGYTLLSGLVGTTLGALAAFGIAQSIGPLTGDMFDVTFYISPQSILIAYSLGVVITFLAVALSSWRVSRLNVVAAVRDIPEVYRARRNRKQLVWALAMVVGGGLLTWWGYVAAIMAPFTIGMTLIPFGIASLLVYFGVNARLVLSVAGIYAIIFWLLPDGMFTDLFGEMSGEVDMFFVSGVGIVASSTIVIIQNLDAILSVAERLGGRVRGKLPAIRLAVSYPGADKGRSGMTIAMFSLIVFSLVMTAAITENISAAFLTDEANAGWDVQLELPSGVEVDDVEGTLANQGIDPADIESVGIAQQPNLFANQVMSANGEWNTLPIHVPDESFLAESDLEFQARAEGYDSDAAIIEALQTEDDVMVIYSELAGGAGNGFEEGGFATFEGVERSGSFAAPTVELRTDADEQQSVRVIGVLDQKFSNLFFAFTGQPTADAVFAPDTSSADSIYMMTADGVDPTALANEAELAFFAYGAQGTDLHQELEEAQSTIQGFFYILQGFMGLGLIVGIAAVGVIAFRSVVERRQQIGMLRALGFQRGLVAQSFVMESAIVVLLGVVAGATLGLLLAWNLMTSEFFDEAGDGVAFIVPWLTISVTLAASIVAALLMAWLPARQASRVIPAEALRYE